jgi:transcriptional regulator of acetoin/glycerol metabolism
LTAVPLAFTHDALHSLREGLDWLPVAEQVLAPHAALVRESGHVLTLFDLEGHMVSSAGDPHTLARLEDIHFMPGASWAEDVAGTNGPGTALATRAPVHVVGAEHYCEAWHAWHCAAVPLTGPGGELLGALDLSGARLKATPWALQTAQLLAGLVEQGLAARESARQVAVLGRYAELMARYPSEALFAVDARGVVLAANAAARARGAPARLPVHGCRTLGPTPGAAWLHDATVFPVGSRDGAVVLARLEVTRPSARRPASTRYTFDDLIGRAPALVKAIAGAKAASTTRLPVLVRGESGVGKEVLAQAIHAASDRHAGPFVAVNCAALSAELVESELFGYAEGAFSGARAGGQRGKFEHADGGTIFLDEVGELPLAAQATLLRVLQEGELAVVGAALPRRVDVRVVAATNAPLDEAVREGRFRLDLFHRLDVLAVTLPPLRDRVGDLPMLVEHLRARVERDAGFPLLLGEGVLEALAAHAWPGNVRELENVLRRVAVQAQGATVEVGHLPFDRSTQAASPGREPHAAHLMAVVQRSKNMTEAAASLGVTRSTLYRQLERLNLRPGRTVVRG